MSNFKDLCFFYFSLSSKWMEKAFWNETAQRDQETCQIFLLFLLIKATSKLALKTTLWSHPSSSSSSSSSHHHHHHHHSCKEFLFVGFKVLFFFSLCSSRRVCVCVCDSVAGRSPPLFIWKVRKKINSYLRTPVLVHAPMKECVCVKCVCVKRQNTHSCRGDRERRPTKWKRGGGGRIERDGRV